MLLLYISILNKTKTLKDTIASYNGYKQTNNLGKGSENLFHNLLTYLLLSKGSVSDFNIFCEIENLFIEAITLLEIGKESWKVIIILSLYL